MKLYINSYRRLIIFCSIIMSKKLKNRYFFINVVYDNNFPYNIHKKYLSFSFTHNNNTAKYN